MVDRNGRLDGAPASCVPELLGALQTSVQRFAGAVQSDDLTLLVARATLPAAPAPEADGSNAPSAA